MKRVYFLFLTSLCVFVFNSCDSKKQPPAKDSTSSSVETLLFFGQKPPGLTPELFAPNVVSTNALEIEVAVSPDLKEFYFIRQKKGERPKSHLIQYEDGQLKTSEVDRPSGEVFISTDNKIMHLGNKYKERTASGWSEEKNLGATFDKFEIMRLTASNNQSYFFDERDTIGTIWCSRWIDNEREEPKALSKKINSGTFTSHPFIATDESYLIWDSEREGGYGGSDLYISFRQADGTWGDAINMGSEINTEVDDTYGSVTSDGKYFFFNRVRLGESFEDSEANIYWIDAQVIEQLKQK